MKDDKEELTREEILKRSRKENQTGDEREREKWKFVPYCGYLGAILAIIILEIVYLVLDFNSLYVDSLMVILGTMSAAQLICQAVVTARTQKKIKIVILILALIVTICAVSEWVLFGLKISGVDI